MGFEAKVKLTRNLLREDTFLKKDVLRALRAASTAFADGVDEEQRIALELYKRMVQEKETE